MNMLINARSYAGEGLLVARIDAQRHVHSNQVLRRTIKHRDDRKWRASLEPENDTKAFEAYEDRERILDHLSDVWWYGEQYWSSMSSIVSLCERSHNRVDALLFAENLLFTKRAA